MTDDSNQPATKGDITTLELRMDTKFDNFRDEITQTFDIKLETVRDEITQTFDTKLETVRDEIIRAFGIAEENIRKESAHVDEVADLENRVRRIESHLEMDKG